MSMVVPSTRARESKPKLWVVMIRAILFDMNGIIIDDEHLHEITVKETVKPFEIDLTHQTYLDCCAGQTDREGYEHIASKYATSLPLDALLEQKSKLYRALYSSNKESYPGVVDLIHLLGKNFTLALTSSSSRAEIDLIIKDFGVDDAFKVIVSADDVTKGKPDPEPYRITVDKLGLKPQECLAIEDSPNGILSATTAGCYCIAVTTTHIKNDLLRANLIVDSFYEITSESIRGLAHEL